MSYCIYLRKSRADADAEARGEGETLSRHETTLLALAKKMNITVTKIYKEIVSGETIATRPVMQELLSDIESGTWNGVFVMEVERLARGDTADQGIVSTTFKYSNTKIITPIKTYDPNNEFDEEYFEFGLFMSRREYKTINRRLQNGILMSVQQGHFMGSTPPLGYDIIKSPDGKGNILKINPEEKKLIEQIFNWYIDGDGGTVISQKLNNLGYRTSRGNHFTQSYISNIITNPVYMGKIAWKKRKVVKSMQDGRVVKSRPRAKEYIVVDGQHDPIISTETFEAAQLRRKTNPALPVAANRKLGNPLAGLIICGLCGHSMLRRAPSKTSNDSILCRTSYCQCIGSKTEVLESEVLNALKEWTNEAKLTITERPQKTAENSKELEAIIEHSECELTALHVQRNKLCELLERGVYSEELFMKRNQAIEASIKNHKKLIDETKHELDSLSSYSDHLKDLIPKAEETISVYSTLTDVEAKNKALKSIVEKVVYVKTEKGNRGKSVPFHLQLFPKIPN